MPLKIEQSTKQPDGYSDYKYSYIRIHLEAHDTDVNLVLPDGNVIGLQFRVESPSLDVCLPKDHLVTNWKGDDMAAAPQFEWHEHIRIAKQLVIDLPPTCLCECGNCP